MILSCWGSSWGTWRAGLGVCQMGVDNAAGVMKNIVPIVMAGVLGIYGLIVAVILTQGVVPPDGGSGQNVYSTFNGYTHVRIRESSFVPLTWSFAARCWFVLWFILSCVGWSDWDFGRSWCKIVWAKI